MGYSLKDLLSQQAAVRAKDPTFTPARAESNNPLPPIGTDFMTAMQTARMEADARIEAEKEQVKREARDVENLRRLEMQELSQLDDDGAPHHYVESRDLVHVQLPAIYDPWAEVEEAETIDDESEYYFNEYDSYEREDDDYGFDDIMAGVQVKPDPSQEAAVRILSGVQYGCLIGAAGTGKTTTTRLLLNTLINGDAAAGIEPLRLSRVNLRAYQASTAETGEDGEAERDLIPSIAFCAYTGQATQVLKSKMPGSWQKNVFTIHSLLGFYPEKYTKADGKPGMRFVPYYTAEIKMPWDTIFIDEASMVSIELWHMLLAAAKPGCRFYLIGDLNQLPPPVGQGILGFALSKWVVCELTHVHRQSNDLENVIVDTAHKVLNGRTIEFQNPMHTPDWRVIGFELPHDHAMAFNKIVNICKGLAEKKMPDGDKVYDPWRDRVMTTMNGYDENTSASLLGQHPINDALSQIFADPANPRVIIDAQTVQKRFAIGYRVMATKNESPAEINRVTNGLTGIITDIQENTKWFGDRRLVGLEDEVTENRKAMIKEAMSHRGETALDAANAAAKEASQHLDAFQSDWTQTVGEEEATQRNGGPASHIVTVKYDNGGTREYSMNAQIEQLRIAYASTTHKAQGAEFPTAIIVVHHASRQMLSRENLYTAVTRASKRVILLYSEYGLRIALSTQKITGVTLAQKIKQYQRLMGEGDTGVLGFKMVNVRLSEHDK